MSVEVLNPVRKVKLSNGEEVEVREMNWRAAMEFLNNLSKQFSELLDKDGGWTFEVGKVVELVSRTEALANQLVLGSTKKEKAWLDELTFSDVMALLDEAVALNLSPEVLAKGKKLAERVGAALGVKLGISVTQSTS